MYKFRSLAAIFMYLLISAKGLPSCASESLSHFDLLLHTVTYGQAKLDFDEHNMKLEPLDHRFVVISRSPAWDLVVYNPKRQLIFRIPQSLIRTMTQTTTVRRAFRGSPQEKVSKFQTAQITVLSGPSVPKGISYGSTIYQSANGKASNTEVFYEYSLLNEKVAPGLSKTIEDFLDLPLNDRLPLRLYVVTKNGAKGPIYQTTSLKKVNGKVDCEIPTHLKNAQTFDQVIFNMDKLKNMANDFFAPAPEP